MHISMSDIYSCIRSNVGKVYMSVVAALAEKRIVTSRLWSKLRLFGIGLREG